MEYQILKPPPRRGRTAWTILVVVLVTAVATGVYLVGRHRSAHDRGAVAGERSQGRSGALQLVRDRRDAVGIDRAGFAAGPYPGGNM